MLHSIFFIFGRCNPPYIIFCFINTYLISALLCIHASTHFEFQLHLSFVIAGVSWVWFCSQVTPLFLSGKMTPTHNPALPSPSLPLRPSLPQQTKTRPLLSHTHAQTYTDELIALSPIVPHVFVFISDTLPSIWNKSPCFHQYSSKHLNPALT